MIEATHDGRTWTAWCEALGVDDVYYRWAHLQLWGDAWQLQPLGIRYVDPAGTVLLPLLRSSLDALPGGTGRCDLRTAYDFGGPLLRGSDAVLPRFEAAWDALLADLRCVTLFQRIHPFHPRWPSAATVHAQNHVVDLSGGIEAVRARTYGSWRRDRVKAERLGCTTAVEADPTLFARLYAGTMDRLEAPAWYRFSEATLAALIALPEVTQLVTRGPDGTPLASALSLRSGDVRFYHLSASDPAGRGFFPNHHLLDGLLAHAIDDGCHTVHLGGGAPSLTRFKSRVGSHTVPYRVERRVVDPPTYTALCEATGCHDGAFPAYLGVRP